MDVNIIDSHAHIMLDPYASLSPVEPERVMEGFARYGVEQAWFSSADALVSNQTDDHRRSNDRMAELQQRFEQPKQEYWTFGFAARILALLHRATGRQDFLDGALGYIEVFERCHEDRWTHWANDKVAWASAALYQTTGDSVHLERVGRCFDPIV